MQPALADVQAETTAELMNELNRISNKLEEVDAKNNARVTKSNSNWKQELQRVGLKWCVG